MTPILDIRMHDGSRHFGSLPERVSVTAQEIALLRSRTTGLSGARLIEVVTDHITEAWIDFDYAGHRFTMNNQFDDWWFFVADPACPDDTLHAVLGHFAQLLTQG